MGKQSQIRLNHINLTWENLLARK